MLFVALPGLRTNKPPRCPSRYVADTLREIAAIAVLHEVTFHQLRHSRGSQLAQAGVPDHVIAAQLGHTDVRTTQRNYIHLAPGQGADAAERIRRLSTMRVPSPGANLVLNPARDEARQVPLPEDQACLLKALGNRPATDPCHGGA